MKHLYMGFAAFAIVIIIVILVTKSSSNKETFDRTRPTVRLFVSRRCGHCKNVEADWKALTTRKNKNYNLLKIDIVDNIHLAREYGVKSTPSLMIDYDTVATGADDINSYVKSL